MYLSKLVLDPRHPQARRDLADPYEMHRTLCRAFAPTPYEPPHRFLWRAETENGGRLAAGVTVLVQSTQPAAWDALIAHTGYAMTVHPNKAVDLSVLVRSGRRYRFRLVANPTVTRGGKRHGLIQEQEQHVWLERQGERCGFQLLEAVRTASERIVVSQGRTGHRITVQSVRFDGVLEATGAESLRSALLNGLGHAKALGLGMLSLAPAG